MATSQSASLLSLAAFVRRRAGPLGAALVGLTFAVLALDHLYSDLWGPHLLGLRLLYAALATLVVAYLWLLSVGARGPNDSMP